jgi:hypothetical protein
VLVHQALLGLHAAQQQVLARHLGGQAHPCRASGPVRGLELGAGRFGLLPVVAPQVQLPAGLAAPLVLVIGPRRQAQPGQRRVGTESVLTISSSLKMRA